MDRAGKLPKLQDEERESTYGYVYAVSGPGTIFIYIIQYHIMQKLYAPNSIAPLIPKDDGPTNHNPYAKIEASHLGLIL